MYLQESIDSDDWDYSFMMRMIIMGIAAFVILLAVLAIEEMWEAFIMLFIFGYWICWDLKKIELMERELNVKYYMRICSRDHKVEYKDIDKVEFIGRGKLLIREFRVTSAERRYAETIKVMDEDKIRETIKDLRSKCVKVELKDCMKEEKKLFDVYPDLVQRRFRRTR